MRVLVVEDDQDLALNIAEYHEPRGIQMDFAYDGKAALAIAMAESFDVIVLDIGLPGFDGVSVATKLRESGCSAPILFMTARDTLPDKEAAYESGADDYLVKPFSLKELYLRVNALYRRSVGLQSSSLHFEGLSLDMQTQTFRFNGSVLKLNRLQHALLFLLLQRAPKLVPKDIIAEELWHGDAPSNDALRVLVYEVRRALSQAGDPGIVHTEFGQGYALRSVND